MRSLGFDQFGNEQLVGTDAQGNYVLKTKYADCANVGTQSCAKQATATARI